MPSSDSASTVSSEVWSAPVATDATNAHVEIPGSKSLTNRYLALAALADGPTTLHGVLQSRDSQLMIDSLSALGAQFTPGDTPTSLQVTPISVGARVSNNESPVSIDCGLAGTVMRFVPPIAALMDGAVHFDGDLAARVRPMGPIFDGLSQAGVEITQDSPTEVSGGNPSALPEYLPATVHGTGRVTGGVVKIDAGGSSQFISALLLAAPKFRDGLHLHHTGEHTPSPEHVGMTVELLRQAGVTIDDTEPQQWRVHPGDIHVPETAIEPDLSNAGPYLAAAVVTGGTVRIPHWPANTTQIGDRWREILPRFGATVHLDLVDGASHGTLVVSGAIDPSTGKPRIRGAGELDNLAELAPTAAALAVLADGPTTLTSIGHLRGHETDRLTALTTEAGRLGATVVEGPDYLQFEPAAELHPARLSTYEDHRMATFAAVLGLAIPGIQVENIETTAKTMPRFPEAWMQLVHPKVRTESVNSVRA